MGPSADLRASARARKWSSTKRRIVEERLLCCRSTSMDETSVPTGVPRAVAISRSASQNSSSMLILVLCPAMTIDLFKTRDLRIPLMKHPHQAAPQGTRYDRVIGEPRNPGVARLVCRLMVVRSAGRPFLNAYAVPPPSPPDASISATRISMPCTIEATQVRPA
jgi:hypothetical protein